MPRIDIELTSARPDGTWTWRAAGARQPKGVVNGSVLPAGAKVGDVVRAEADVEIDGITITSTLAPRTKRPEPERLPVFGTQKDEPLVSGPKEAFSGDVRGDRGRSRTDRRFGGRTGPDERGARPGAGPRADRSGRGDRGDNRGGGERGRQPADSERADRRPADRPAGDRRPADRRPGERPAGDRRPGDRPRGDAPSRETPARAGGDRGGRDANRATGDRRPAAAPADRRRQRPKRFHPRRVHRDDVLAALAPEERPVAEQLLRGGIPAVRHALREQNAKARAAGEPEIKADALLAMAERLLPRLRWAEWRDRAEAAAADVDDIDLSDLRAVVVGSDAARDEESRELARRLDEALGRRIGEETKRWADEISESLDDGRVVRALRTSARPPQPGVRCPPDLATRLSEAAGQAMAPDAPVDRWLALLEAVSGSPVRRSVHPSGIPTASGDEVMKAAREAITQVPGLASLVGPQPPPRPGRPPAPPRGDQPAEAGRQAS